eukprot:GEZU01039492.1.p1 GENE.GEZU01039492.1~~GEZU01039492.1.p1  ORF type:complete len:121 (-),score=11.59 GEZU01039492.1:182-544(-)
MYKCINVKKSLCLLEVLRQKDHCCLLLFRFQALLLAPSTGKNRILSPHKVCQRHYKMYPNQFPQYQPQQHQQQYYYGHYIIIINHRYHRISIDKPIYRIILMDVRSILNNLGGAVFILSY